mgnify:CR=1 FL=1
MKNVIPMSTLLFIIAMVLTVGCSSTTIAPNSEISKVKSADGSLIFYGVRGQGETTIVFVHGWACNHGFWKPQLDYFSKNYRTVWVDLAGHGSSNSNRQEYTMSAFGGDIASVVNKIDAKNVILVGHSMGGPVVIEAAKKLGDKVIGIIGVDTFYTPFKYPKSEEKIEEFVKPFKKDFVATSEGLVKSMFTASADLELIESIAKQMSAADQSMGVSAMYEIFRWNAKNGPAELEEFSKILRNINGAPTGKEVPLHERVTLIKGVDHFVPQVKPDEFNKVLESLTESFKVDYGS